MVSMKRTLFIIFSISIFTFAISGCEGKLDDLIEDGRYVVSKDTNYATFEGLVDSFEVESSYAYKRFNIKSTGSNWTLSSQESWIHFNPSSGVGSQVVAFSFDANPYAYKRRIGTITLSTDGNSVNMTAIQEAATPIMEYNPSNISMGVTGDTATIDVNTNCTNIKVSSCPDFAQANYSNGKLVVTTEPNITGKDRSGNVELSYDYLPYQRDSLTTKSISIAIRQDGPTLSVSPTDNNISANGGQTKVNISSNLPWKAVCSENWLQCNPASGNSGRNTMTVTVASNETDNNRTGNISFFIGTHNMQTIKINQDGPTLFVSPTDNYVGFNGGKIKVNVTSNITWKAVCSENWLQCNPTSGKSGSTTMTITVAPNDGIYHSRTANISFYVGTYNVQTIEIKQY